MRRICKLRAQNFQFFWYRILTTLAYSPTISGVARICGEEGQSWKLGHGAPTADFRAGCSSCSMTNSFVTNAVMIERAVSCWRLNQLISQTTQYLDSWLSDLRQSELNMKLLKVEGGARARVPHSWRRYCLLFVVQSSVITHCVGLFGKHSPAMYDRSVQHLYVKINTRVTFQLCDWYISMLHHTSCNIYT